jgi:hypothetical protein
MNKQIQGSVALLLVATISALAGGQKTSTVVPTLQASCHSCSPSEAIMFSGSGYKGRSTVILDIQGPASYSISTTSDSNGNIYVSYGTVLTYPAGNYTVTASAVSGKSVSVVATDYFYVQ